MFRARGEVAVSFREGRKPFLGGRHRKSKKHQCLSSVHWQWQQKNRLKSHEGALGTTDTLRDFMVSHWSVLAVLTGAKMIVSIWICEVRKFHPRVSLRFYRMFSICMTAAERIEDVANARAGGDERLCLHSLRWGGCCTSQHLYHLLRKWRKWELKGWGSAISYGPNWATKKQKLLLSIILVG